MKNSKKSSLVSIIMPVYNAGDFLVDAIESIKKQTYKNWELLAVNDGSTDNSFTLLKKLAKKDKRIKVFNLKDNQGLGAAANLAIGQAKGKLLTRFDADDLMPKTRLERQVKYLLDNPQILAVGGQCVMIGENDKLLGRKNFPLTDSKIRKMAFITMSLQAGTMMINRSNLPKDFAFYSTIHHYFEDHELLFKLLQIGQVANLPQTMLYYRQHNGNSTKLVNLKKVFFSLLKLRFEAFLNGLIPDINGLLANLIQLILVTILPNKLIEKLYFYLRVENKSHKKIRSKIIDKIIGKIINNKIYTKKTRPIFQ